MQKGIFLAGLTFVATLASNAQAAEWNCSIHNWNLLSTAQDANEGFYVTDGQNDAFPSVRFETSDLAGNVVAFAKKEKLSSFCHLDNGTESLISVFRTNTYTLPRSGVSGEACTSYDNLNLKIRQDDNGAYNIVSGTTVVLSVNDAESAFQAKAVIQNLKLSQRCTLAQSNLSYFR